MGSNRAANNGEMSLFDVCYKKVIKISLNAAPSALRTIFKRHLDQIIFSVGENKYYSEWVILVHYA